MKLLLAGLIIIWCAGCGAGWGLKDINASVSANVCAGVEVQLENGEVSTEWTVATCAKAETLGIALPEFCFGTDSTD